MHRTSQRLRHVAGLALLAGLVAVPRPGRAGSVPLLLAQTTPSPAPVPDSPGALRPVERAFLTAATQAARLATEMSRLAVSQASSSSVRDFAQQLVGDDGQMDNALEALARRKAVALPLQPTSFSDPTRDLARQTGADFDRAYVRAALALTQRTLQLCETAVANARDPEVKELAGSLLPVVRDHVNKTTELAKAL